MCHSVPDTEPMKCVERLHYIYHAKDAYYDHFNIFHSFPSPRPQTWGVLKERWMTFGWLSSEFRTPEYVQFDQFDVPDDAPACVREFVFNLFNGGDMPLVKDGADSAEFERYMDDVMVSLITYIVKPFREAQRQVKETRSTMRLSRSEAKRLQVIM
jgi:hypothetical protein